MLKHSYIVQNWDSFDIRKWRMWRFLLVISAVAEPESTRRGSTISPVECPPQLQIIIPPGSSASVRIWSPHVEVLSWNKIRCAGTLFFGQQAVESGEAACCIMLIHHWKC